MVRLQSVHRHTGLTHHFYFFFDIRALWRSVVSARVPECQKFNGGLTSMALNTMGGLIFATIRKTVALDGLNDTTPRRVIIPHTYFQW